MAAPWPADRLPLIQWLVPGSTGGAADELDRTWTPHRDPWLDRALNNFTRFLISTTFQPELRPPPPFAGASIGVTDPEHAEHLENDDDAFNHILAVLFDVHPLNQPPLEAGLRPSPRTYLVPIAAAAPTDKSGTLECTPLPAERTSAGRQRGPVCVLPVVPTRLA